MNSSSARNRCVVTCIAVTAFLSCLRFPGARSVGPNGIGAASPTPWDDPAAAMTDQLQYGAFGAQVAERSRSPLTKRSSRSDDSAKKIQLGRQFLQKYPKSPLAERVDAGLVDVYRAQQDWKDTYLSADNALALQPDDVDVLTTVGWTIPHVYDPNDPDADQALDKATTYAQHAIEVLAKMPKPPNLTDAQFEASKTKRLLQAHSALGLVYFRREDYDNSVKELQQSTKNNPSPDQTDLFVLGVDLQNLGATARLWTPSISAPRSLEPCRINASEAPTRRKSRSARQVQRKH